jgi:diguanylate cyclase (GGDEF)-like protein
MKILQLQRSNTAKLADFGMALSADPSLTSKVLALANSAACAPPKPITKVSEAITRIGLKNLLSLVFGLSIGGIFNKLGIPPTDAKGLWRASLLKAVAAREIATKLDPALAEEAYVCGLLQDVSLPVIFSTDPSAWPETAAILDLEPAARKQREEALYGVEHGAYGMLIAARIGLPELFRNAILLHHQTGPALAKLGSPALAAAVEFAAVLPHRLTSVNAATTQKLAAKLKALDPAGKLDHAELLKTVAANYAGTLVLLGESDESSAAVKEFLQAVGAEVAGILGAAIGDSLSQISHLKSRGAELEGKIADLKQAALRSEYDVLTKALSRRGFVTRAERFLALAREYETPCAVGFVDVDNFKSMNDRLGHAAGDAALVQVADRLCEHFKGRGIVGRVGGDEFAFLLIAKNRDEVSAEADRMTELMAGMSVPGSGAAAADALPLTTSIGMLWLGVPTADQTPEVTLKSADEVMYGVKRSGKARCALGAAG